MARATNELRRQRFADRHRRRPAISARAIAAGAWRDGRRASIVVKRAAATGAEAERPSRGARSSPSGRQGRWSHVGDGGRMPAGHAGRWGGRGHTETLRPPIDILVNNAATAAGKGKGPVRRDGTTPNGAAILDVTLDGRVPLRQGLVLRACAKKAGRGPSSTSAA